MMRHLANRWCTALAASLISFTPPASAQSLLVIPDLSKGSIRGVAVEARRDSVRQRFLDRFPDRRAAADSAARAATVTRRDADLIGEMPPEVSEQFWGEARSKILPGSSLGVGDGRAAIYTEMGHVLTGSWRIAVGTALAVATQEEEDSAESGADDIPPGLNRFIAGGGSLSLQMLRPLWLAQAGTYNRFGIILAPRLWANLPALTSADRVDDYGGEAAASLLFQRQDNRGRPFMTVEARVGWVGGSDSFYRTIGNEAASTFAYLAPSLTLSIVDQVNIGVSTLVSSDLASPGLRLTLSLLNTDREEGSAASESGTQP